MTRINARKLRVIRGKLLLSIVYAGWLLVGCSLPMPNPATPQRPVPTAVPPRTLVATYTPAAHPTALTLLPAPLPSPTTVAVTPIPFDQTTVELRYTIPALGLDRRLEGKLGGQVIVVDEATGLALERTNQGGLLSELQQILPHIELSPVPAGCDDCVHVGYTLSQSNLEAEGWLQDKRLLASVENYFRQVLGPHFPPQTAVGLHRAPSPYAPAHTLAITTDGRAWLWLAIDAQIPPPIAGPAGALIALEQLPLDQLQAAYEVDCSGQLPRETLQVRPTSQSEARQIAVTCPEYALPSLLLPLYLQLDEAIAPRLTAVAGPPRPAAAFPLPAVLDYRRADGPRLLLFEDGRLTVSTAVRTISTTLSASSALSLTAPLLASGVLQLGLTTFQLTDEEGATAVPLRTLLLLRGPEGVVDAAWPGETAVPLLAALDALIDQLLLPETAVLPTPTAATP